MTSVPKLHDCEIVGYIADGERRTITFTVFPPKGQPQFPERLVFLGVEGYFLEHDLRRNIIYSVEERELAQFLSENEATFVRESKWGWPLFWKGSLAQSAEFLSSSGCRVWAIGSSYGLSGWVVARDAEWHGRDA